MEKDFDQSTWQSPKPEKNPRKDRPEMIPGLQEIPETERKKPVNPEIIRGILDNLDENGFEKEKEKRPPTLH